MSEKMIKFDFDTNDGEVDVKIKNVSSAEVAFVIGNLLQIVEKHSPNTDIEHFVQAILKTNKEIGQT